MIRTRCWLGTLVALGAAATTAHAADKLVELRADKLEITDAVLGGEGAVTLAVPIIAAPSKPARPAAGEAQPPAVPAPPRLDQLEARLGYAAFGNAPLRGAPFAPTLALADDKRHWQLSLGFDARTVARPGSYTVAIDLVRLGSDDIVQTLTVTLVRPAAELRAVPQAIVVDVVQLLPRPVDALDAGVRLTLEETTGLTRAAFTVADARRTEADGQRVPAAMTLTGAGVVPAGGALALTVALGGAFPPGKTIGALEVRSDQARPLEIKYELRTRIAWPAILGCLALGWGVGFGLRVGLRWYTARQHALGQIADVEQEAIALNKAIADPKLGAPEVIRACEAARKDWRTADAHVVKLRARLDEVKATFQPVLDAARLRLAGFARAVSAEWRLPADVAGALPALKRTLAAANAELAVGNASAAAQLLDDAFGDQVAALCKRVEAWRATSLTSATQLEIAPGLAVWPVPTGTMAADAAAKWRALVLAVPTEKPADNDALIALLRAVDATYGHLAAAARQQLTSWRMVLDVCVSELADLPSKPLALLPGKLPDAGNAELTLAKLTTVARPIAEEFRATLLGVVRADAPGRKQIEATIADGKWALAAKQVRELVGPPRTSRGGNSGSIPIPTIALAAASEPVNMRAITMTAGEPAPAPLPTAEAVAAARRRARKLELAALTTTSVISAGLLLVFYAVHFSTARTATWLDLVGVAVQAGSVDIGIAALVTAAKNLTRA
jgi:hypothetical protein